MTSWSPTGWGRRCASSRSGSTGSGRGSDFAADDVRQRQETGGERALRLGTLDDVEMSEIYSPISWQVFDRLDESMDPLGPDELFDVVARHVSSGGRALDVGCRDARYLIQLAERSASPVSVSIRSRGTLTGRPRQSRMPDSPEVCRWNSAASSHPRTFPDPLTWCGVGMSSRCLRTWTEPSGE